MDQVNLLKVKSNFEAASITPGSCYSFLNFASLSAFFKSSEKGEITYYCDGFLMCMLIGVIKRQKIKRASFDFTSIAEDVFQFAEKNEKSVFFVGATEQEVTAFQVKILKRYPNIVIKGYQNGFFSQKEEHQLIDKIKELSVDIVVAGLGAGKQEQFILKLKTAGYQGCSFTCGGFIRQEAGSNGDYYPDWINNMNLRAFYRMYKEPHTIRRYLLDYPKNVIHFFVRFITKKIYVNII